MALFSAQVISLLGSGVTTVGLTLYIYNIAGAGPASIVLGQALIAIPSGTLLAEHTRDDERGRAYAAHFALTHACWLITYPAAGLATARFGPAMAITAAGVICGAITLIAARINVREEAG